MTVHGSPFDSQIRELDLTPVRYQLVVLCNWDLLRIEAAEQEYRCFLQLIRNDPHTPHAPTPDADEFWHQHILCTTLYTRDCKTLFGHYLHHYPFSGRFGTDDARQQRQRFEHSRASIAGMIQKERSRSVIQPTGDER